MNRNEKVTLNLIYLLMIVTAAGCFVICKIRYNSFIFTVFVTLLTCFTHITIRFIFANWIYIFLAGFVKDDNWWFKERPFEKSLYKILRVKKWKNKLPTWQDGDFNIKEADRSVIIANMNKAEFYHEICMILSFIPLLYAIPFGKFWIFLITSAGGALFDFLFVMIQRYNKPRMRKSAGMKKHENFL